MPGLIRTPAAEDDLLEIAYFIAVEQGRPLTAEQIIDDIVAKCGEYAASPLIGTAVPALGEGYPELPFQAMGSYLSTHRRRHRGAADR